MVNDRPIAASTFRDFGSRTDRDLYTAAVRAARHLNLGDLELLYGYTIDNLARHWLDEHPDGPADDLAEVRADILAEILAAAIGVTVEVVNRALSSEPILGQFEGPVR